MRLDDVERRALRNALEGVEAPVYLFGSRVDDDRKSGDIDVLVLTFGGPPSPGLERAAETVLKAFLIEARWPDGRATIAYGPR